jgi:hypothetical protein
MNPACEAMNGTCEGLEPRAWIHPISQDLVAACRRFADEAASSSEPAVIRSSNIACVTIGASAVEASLNEWVAISRQIEDARLPVPFWDAIRGLARSLSLRARWDLISGAAGGQQWDASLEPFQSFDTLVSLRNEIVHYKADFLEDTVAPLGRIRNLAAQLLKTKSVNDEPAGWARLLLDCPDLGPWAIRCVEQLHGRIPSLLLGPMRSDEAAPEPNVGPPGAAPRRPN